MKNIVRIKAMNVDEMAEFLMNWNNAIYDRIDSPYAEYRIKEYRNMTKQWLESESEE